MCIWSNSVLRAWIHTPFLRRAACSCILWLHTGNVTLWSDKQACGVGWQVNLGNCQQYKNYVFNCSASKFTVGGSIVCPVFVQQLAQHYPWQGHWRPPCKQKAVRSEQWQHWWEQSLCGAGQPPTTCLDTFPIYCASLPGIFSNNFFITQMRALRLAKTTVSSKVTNFFSCHLCCLFSFFH